jgi:DNA-binding beta-propeller fold protein YncE
MLSRKSIISYLVILVQFFGSCTRNDPDPDYQHVSFPFLKSRGVFVINEGNFMQGNGSLSFYSCDSGKIYNNLFTTANNRPPGDIPFSMEMDRDGKLYLVVNNSGKIEILNRNNMESEQVITNLISPRYMLIVNSGKAYVSSLYSEYLTVIDLKTGYVSGTINLGFSSETMTMAEGKAYISSWVEGSEVIVVDTNSDLVIDTLFCGNEPESMVIDRNSKLWVLCSGGYTGLYSPELICFDLTDYKVSKRFIFPSKDEMPSSLSINPGRDTLYFINNDVWSLGISDISLPVNPLIERNGRNYYRMVIDKVTGNIFVTNAMDYQGRGYLLIFKPDGTVIDSLKAGIIPGNLYFVDDAE